ncbi:MAG TPA: RnfABCDGE type electron transport complex subunit B [Bacteroidales bacterium]|jgi:Na+-translocating ferredoxin:NAD+ oxidoreductase RNF subunit RnfB|nr:RnfABCDGE type electron transport complex subunit B [Bacteroidales bacterium]HNR41402.1 RnfABCDGE type electron transport complex subunit B [Bacteroidales bacterium]HPM18535.1 RnfABCDGE type electron transport complex subunit B [Bacteroidales bacterium]HQG76206.1 RnfABCDGE type electron transport complex subunit B [Bacteroidales bacterium]
MMGSTVIITIITLSLLALASSVILYFVAQRFRVFEDPRIDEVQAILPAANCGGCGFAGCRNFAEALVKAETFEGLNCPVGGATVMNEAARILGKVAEVVDPTVAVLLCNGSPEFRPRTSRYNGASECRISHSLYLGDTDCSWGCLGDGDCVRSCSFGAMYMDPVTMLPVIIDDKCVSCGMCVKACPRHLIELRKRAKKDRKIYVACQNCDKGGPARRACKVACIGCGKCVKVCAFDAITMENNLAYIDAVKCTFCRKCVVECPTNSILEINFPPRKPKAEPQAEVAKV